MSAAWRRCRYRHISSGSVLCAQILTLGRVERQSDRVRVDDLDRSVLAMSSSLMILLVAL